MVNKVTSFAAVLATATLLAQPATAAQWAAQTATQLAPKPSARQWPKRPYPAVLSTALALPTQDVTVRVLQRGPYGEVVAINEGRITPKDWGRVVTVAGVSLVAKPLGGALSLAVKPAGYEILGPSRPKGTLHYTLKSNSTLHSVVGASPGAVADLIVTFGKETAKPSAPLR